MSFTPRSYFHALAQRRTLVFVLLCLLTFFAADPSGTRAHVPLWVSIGIWSVAFFIYLNFYHLQFLALAALRNRPSGLRVPTPLLGFLALVPTTYICENLVVLASRGSYEVDIPYQITFFFLAVQGLETVFYRYILPQALAGSEPQEDPAASTEAEDATDERHLIIGGERIPIQKLVHIEAREHHVHLTLADARKLLRARMADVVAQTRPEDGVQPHRSWWVARDAACTVERENGRHVLRLKDETIVPVARTRLPDVQEWIEKHL